MVKVDQPIYNRTKSATDRRSARGGKDFSCWSIGWCRDQYTITRVIGYYTSLKIFLDRVRMLKSWAADVSKLCPTLSDENVRILRGILEQIINDLFICLENARISLHCLLERGSLHDQSIFVCLLSEIRAFTFLRTRTSNVDYTRRRFADRLRPQRNGSERLATSREQIDEAYDELECYSHPAFSRAIRKLLENYDSYYGKGLGNDVADILAGYAIDIEIGSALTESKVVSAA